MLLGGGDILTAIGLLLDPSPMALVPLVADARMEAILGSGCASLAIVRSGIGCYLAFVEKFLSKVGKKLPPTVDELLAYIMHFKCKGTFSIYIGYLFNYFSYLVYHINRLN